MKTMTLLIFTLLLISQSAFAVDCKSLWRNGFPSAPYQNDSFECTRYSAAGRYELYFSNNLPSTAVQHFLASTEEALRYSAERYASLGNMPPVKVIFYHNFNEIRGTLAATAASFYGILEACPVVIYPPALGLSEEHLQQVLAHEVFHCFQKKNFAPQTHSHEQRLRGLWWLEGTAQFFSNWVYPRIDIEYTNRMPAFDPYASLLMQDYGNAHFFQSLANQTSPEALLDFIRAMPGSATQQSALDAFPDIDNYFHEFAKKMAMRALIDSSGAVAPKSIPAPLVSLPVPAGVATWSSNLTFVPLTPTRFRFTLPRKARIQLRIDPAVADVKVSIKKEHNAIWLPLPADIETTCDRDEIIEVIVTLIDATSTNYQVATLVFEQEEKEDCPCEFTSPPQDACLYGTWDADIDAIRAYYERVTARVEQMTVTSVTGAMEKTFAADGTAFTKIDKLTIGYEMRKNNIVMEMTTEISGDIKWRYSTQGAGRICTEEISNTKNGVATMKIGDFKQVIPMKPAMFAGVNGARRLTYECTESRLIYKTATDGEGNELDYRYIFNRRSR